MSGFNANDSAKLLGMLIQTQFKGLFYARIGDGAIELLRGSSGWTCDGEEYRPELIKAMANAIGALKQSNKVWWGDWRGADGGSRPKYCDEWEALVDVGRRNLLHYEALLLMRESAELAGFYREAQVDTRRKVWVGTGANSEMALRLLGAGAAVSLGMGGQFENIDLIREQLEGLAPEVVYFGAGMAGLCAVVQYWQAHPDTVCIHLGSALDPLGKGTTRGGQLSRVRAIGLLRELL